MYMKKHPDDLYMLVCMCVDDLVIAYSHRSMLESFLGKVRSKFKITQSDNLQKTLGFQIERTTAGGENLLSAKRYNHLLQDLHQT